MSIAAMNYIKGDLLAHRSRKIAVLAHACNPHGLWGGGIAAQFRKRYPMAYKSYAEHCKQHGDALLGTAYIAPTEDPNVLVACLFTSNFELQPAEIVQLTGASMRDLVAQLKDADVEQHQGRPVVNMPMINSGIFGVPWDDTARELARATDVAINVYTL